MDRRRTGYKKVNWIKVTQAASLPLLLGMSGFYCSKLFEQLTACGLHLQLRTVCILFILVVNPPIPVATQSKAYVCGRSDAGIAGSNPFSTWMFFSCVLVCFVGSSLCDELTARSEESYLPGACV